MQAVKHVSEDVTVTSALLEPIANPVLPIFDPQEVSRFLKEYDRYETEVEDRRSEVPPMTVASFNACMERSRLEHMQFIRKLESIAPDKAVEQLTSNYIE